VVVTHSDRGRRQQTESAAIVLDCQDHGESDLIVTFFCQKLGRLTGIAKGAKRSKKRFVNKLELFSSLTILHTTPKNGGLAFIAEAELLDGFLSLRQNVTRYTTATIIREIVLLATKEMEGDEDLYPLLLWVYMNLNRQHPHARLLIYFLIRLYKVIGYEPVLEYCFSCGQHLHEQKSSRFHPTSGGIHCEKCSAKQENSSRIKISTGTLKSLTTAMNQPLERLHRLQLTDISQREALSFLNAYGYHLFQRDTNSWAFLDTVVKHPR